MNRIIYNETDSAYRAAEGLSKSAIDRLLRCPAEYKAGAPFDTSSLAFGRALHMAVLQPENFRQAYRAAQFSGATKAGKAERQEAAAAGQTVLSAGDWSKIAAMRQNIQAHPLAGRLLRAGWPEASIYWDEPDPVSGVPRQCKGRADWLADDPDTGAVWLVDVKTTSGALSAQGLARHVAEYRYHRQAAWYTRGVERNARRVQGFVFIFTSTQAPHLCACCKLDGDALTIGLQECMEGLRILGECERSGRWPGYGGGGAITVGLPAWYTGKAPAAAAPSAPPA